MFPDDERKSFEGTQTPENQTAQSAAGGGEWHGSPYGAGASNSHSEPFTVNPNTGAGESSAPYGSTPYSSAGSAPFGGPNAANFGGNGNPPYGGVPHQPTPPNGPKPKKPKKGWTPSKLIALCLACAIVGGGVSGGAVALANRSQKASTASGTSTVLESDRTATTNVQTQKVQAGDTMSVADIYNTYSNSVVCIQVSTSNGTGAGTGFVITEDGYIVTCYHVIDGATDIAVTFPDSTSYAATLVGGDADNDVAVLKIDASGLTPVVLGDSAQLEVGDTVTAIGNALGTLANTTTTGVVSALDRAITMSDGSVINVLQTDCTINSGNSGGPLFNQYGEVIGIVNAKYSSSGYSSGTATIEGIGFAIPYADVSGKIADLMQYGYITGKPSLGITVSTVSALDAQRYNMVVGAYVNSVNSGSCAETAGLKQGDIITAVNGEEITNYEELVNAKNKMSAGDQMTLDVWRDGETTTLTVTLDEAKPDTSGSTDNSQSGSSGQSDSNNQYGSNGQSGGNGMSPYDFFNYFFGGNGNSNGGQGSW